MYIYIYIYICKNIIHNISFTCKYEKIRQVIQLIAFAPLKRGYLL